MTTPAELPPILRYFNCDHLPPDQQHVAGPFRDLAHLIARELPASAELSAGLRKLLEAKDCFVRASL